MVPAHYLTLDAWPLLPNGKLDRKALPAPTTATNLNEFVAPRTRIERALAEAFAEVLQIAEVSIHDDFFALGGHSLLATQVVSRIEARFSIRLPLRALFESPTVAGISLHVELLLPPEERTLLDADIEEGEL
jgi:pristinamycin I synthase-3/4